MQTRPTKSNVETTPCEVENINQRYTMSQTPYIIQAPCCPTPPPALNVLNPQPNTYNTSLFNYGSGNSTGILKLHQNSNFIFKGIGCTVTAAQTIENQEETNTVTITATGAGGTAAYTGGTGITVNGFDIVLGLNELPISNVMPSNVNFVGNDNSTYSTIPASRVSGLPSMSETALTVTSSNSIQLVTSGIANHSLTAGLKISNVAGNILAVDANGAYAIGNPVNSASLGVKKVATGLSFAYQLDGTTIPTSSINVNAFNNFPVEVLKSLNGGNTPNNGTYQLSVSGGAATLTAPVSGGGATYTGSPTVSISGTNVISANVPAIANAFNSISGVAPANSEFLNRAGNAFAQIPASAISGLPTFTNTQLTVNDSSSIDLLASGTDNHTLSAAVKISAQANNGLSLKTDGLFAAIGGTATTYTASQGVALVGNNFQINGASIPASSIPVSAIANLPSFANTQLSVVDSTSLDFSVSGVDNHTLTGAVKISGDAGNLLVNAANGSGLYVSGATSGGGSISTLSGDVIGTNVASTVAKIRGINVSTTAPTINQVLAFNGTDYVPTTVASSISAVSVSGAPSTAVGDRSKFQIDSPTGGAYFVDFLGITVPLIAPISQVIGFDTGTVTTASIAPQYVGFDLIRAPSAYSKINIETIDFILKNDSTNTISGNVVIEAQDDVGTTIVSSGNIPYPAPGATTLVTVSVSSAQRTRANPTRVTAKVISGGNANLAANVVFTGYAGK